MKDTDDKPEKSSGAVAAEPGGRTVSRLRPAGRTPPRGEARRVPKKAITPREDEEEVSPDARTEQPEPDMPIVELDISRLAGSLDPNVEPNPDLYLEILDPDDAGDLLGGDLTLQQAVPVEHFPLDIPSAYFETLSEYFAEEEAEAAMLEAELAMSTDECALICDEALELAELAQEEMSAEWARGSPNLGSIRES